MISVGAKPIAITNCLNFGNPEKEKNMGEFVECIEGISEASKYLNYPVVSGNVSFYNETKDKGIKPTPSIGGIGLLSDYKKMITMELKNDGNYLYVIGKTEGHLNQSVFARNILSEFEGPPSKMSVKGNRGIKLFSIDGLVNKFEYFFGEDQGRYIVEIKPENLDIVEDMLKKDSIHFDKLGIIESDQITYGNDLKISIDDIKEGYKNWLKEYMVN
jgi:phosphoribosylformylglycinamidine synthase